MPTRLIQSVVIYDSHGLTPFSSYGGGGEDGGERKC
jgi:hypothetical protein